MSIISANPTGVEVTTAAKDSRLTETALAAQTGTTSQIIVPNVIGTNNEGQLMASPTYVGRLVMLRPASTKVATVAINTAGTGYTNGTQVVTLSTGTFQNAATFNVVVESTIPVSATISTQLDQTTPEGPGSYSVETAATNVATTGGGGTGLTMDVTYENAEEVRYITVDTSNTLDVHEVWDMIPVRNEDWALSYIIQDAATLTGLGLINKRVADYTSSREFSVGLGTNFAWFLMVDGVSLETVDNSSTTVADFTVRNAARFDNGYLSGGTPVSGGYMIGTPAVNGEWVFEAEAGSINKIYDWFLTCVTQNVTQMNGDVSAKKIKIFSGSYTMDIGGTSGNPIVIDDFVIEGKGQTTDSIDMNGFTTLTNGVIIATQGLISTDAATIELRNITWVNNLQLIEVDDETWNIVNGTGFIVDPGTQDELLFTSPTLNGVNQLFSLGVTVSEADGTIISGGQVYIHEGLLTDSVFYTNTTSALGTFSQDVLTLNWVELGATTLTETTYGDHTIKAYKYSFVPFVTPFVAQGATGVELPLTLLEDDRLSSTDEATALGLAAGSMLFKQPGDVAKTFFADDFDDDVIDGAWGVTNQNQLLEQNNILDVIVAAGGTDRLEQTVGQQFDDSKDFWMRFRLRLASETSPGSGDHMYGTGVVDSSDNPMCTIGLRHDGSNWKFAARAYSNATGINIIGTQNVVIGKEYHVMAFYRPSTNTTSDDGVLRFWIDGVLEGSKLDIDNADTYSEIHAGNTSSGATPDATFEIHGFGIDTVPIYTPIKHVLYDGGTNILAVGDTVRGADSNAEGTVIQVEGDATSGALSVVNWNGEGFWNDETLYSYDVVVNKFGPLDFTTNASWNDPTRWGTGGIGGLVKANERIEVIIVSGGQDYLENNAITGTEHWWSYDFTLQSGSSTSDNDEFGYTGLRDNAGGTTVATVGVADDTATLKFSINKWDNGSVVTTELASPTLVEDKIHHIVCRWVRETGATAADGIFEVWIDGVAAFSDLGVEDFERSASRFLLGNGFGNTGTATANVHIDNFNLGDTGTAVVTNAIASMHGGAEMKLWDDPTIRSTALHADYDVTNIGSLVVEDAADRLFIEVDGGGTSSYIEKVFQDETEMWMSFLSVYDFDSTTAADEIGISGMYDGTNAAAIIYAHDNGGSPNSINFTYRTDAGLTEVTGLVGAYSDNAAVWASIQYKTASSAGANDGLVRVWIDNVLKVEVLGIDNDTVVCDRIRVGHVDGDGTPTGSVRYWNLNLRNGIEVGTSGTAGYGGGQRPQSGDFSWVYHANSASFFNLYANQSAELAQATVHPDWEDVVTWGGSEHGYAIIPSGASDYKTNRNVERREGVWATDANYALTELATSDYGETWSPASTITIRVEGVTEGAAIKVIANETIGSVTAGDTIFEGLANASGVLEKTDFLYEGDLDVTVRARQQGYPLAAISDDNGIFVDETTESNSSITNDMVFDQGTGGLSSPDDHYYFGHNEEFGQLKIDFTTAGFATGGYLSDWQYWNGAWTNLSGVTDPSNGLTSGAGPAVHTISWTIPGDWVDTTVNSQGPFRYVRLNPTAESTSDARGRTCKLDVTRYLPFTGNRTVTSSGLTVVASWTEDTISIF